MNVKSERLRLGQEGFHDMGLLDAGQLLIEALIFVAKPLMIETEQLQDCSLKIANMNRVFDDVVRKVVGFAMDDSML